MSDTTAPTSPVLPGELTGTALIDRIVRVDHAGEYGAKRIYEGQLAVMRRRKSPAVATVEHMAEQEKQHLDYFANAIAERRARPTLLTPLWHVGAFAMGAATALLGDKAAMACTIAVEETIDGHYAAQVAQLGESEPELKAKIEQFRAEELEHRDTGVEHHGREAPAYPLLSAVVRASTKTAIWLSERV